jgi:hypothetical protein
VSSSLQHKNGGLRFDVGTPLFMNPQARVRGMRLVACAALLLLLAGCSSPAPPAPSTAPTDQALPADAYVPPAAIAPPPLVVVHEAGSFGPQLVSALAGPVLPGTSNERVNFPVERGAVAVVVELVWADQNSVLDLFTSGETFCNVDITQAFVCPAKAYMGDPSGTGAWRADGKAPGQGPRMDRIELTADQWAAYDCQASSCKWGATALAKETAGTAFDFYLSVFYGAAPPPGYTAVPV